MRISRLSKTKHPARLRLATSEGWLVHGFPVLRLLRRLRHSVASSAGVSPRYSRFALCDCHTRPSFPGSLVGTQAFLFRFQSLHTQQRSAALLNISKVIDSLADSG